MAICPSPLSPLSAALLIINEIYTYSFFLLEGHTGSAMNGFSCHVGTLWSHAINNDFFSGIFLPHDFNFLAFLLNLLSLNACTFTPRLRSYCSLIERATAVEKRLILFYVTSRVDATKVSNIFIFVSGQGVKIDCICIIPPIFGRKQWRRLCINKRQYCTY